MYYVLSIQQADLIGRFEYEENQFFDPYQCEQDNGTHVVHSSIVEYLGVDHERLSVLNWEELPQIATLKPKSVKLDF